MISTTLGAGLAAGCVFVDPTLREERVGEVVVTVGDIVGVAGAGVGVDAGSGGIYGVA